MRLALLALLVLTGTFTTNFAMGRHFDYDEEYPPVYADPVAPVVVIKPHEPHVCDGIPDEELRGECHDCVSQGNVISIDEVGTYSCDRPVRPIFGPNEPAFCGTQFAATGGCGSAVSLEWAYEHGIILTPPPNAPSR